MTVERVRFDRLTGARFVRAVRNFAGSEVGGRAKLLSASLIGLLFAISGLNVVNSYVGRDFMTAIEQRSMGAFTRQAILYICVFAGSTVVAVIYRFTEERLGLLWREWLTGKLISLYLDGRNYYRLSDEVAGDGGIANPDQRIADDVRAFTVTTISFVLLFLNGTLTVVAFSGVLWSISPLLFGVAIAYAAVGSLLTIALGRPLVWLNYNQSDQEANLRSALIHVRANAESLVLSRREPQLGARLLRHLDGVVANFRRIITVNRNLGFFTTGYNYLIQIIPALIVAPMFIRGTAPFGVITQSAMAFGQLLGAFSLIVTQFQSISSFAAVVARIGALAEGIERAHAAAVLSMETCPHGHPTLECPICLAEAKLLPAMPKITIREEDGRIAYERLTLELPPDGRVGVRALSLSIPKGTRTLVLGEDEAAKMALLWATAGVWDTGEGRVIRPSADRVMFLPERPYLPPGTLRELLVPPGSAAAVSDQTILTVLRTLHVEDVPARVGGMDAEEHWDNVLSLSEQQLLSVARVVLAAPQFAFLHRIGTTLNDERVADVLRVLSSHAITYVVFEQTDGVPDRYDAVLHLASDGSWTWTPLGRPST
jgi:vitamin B12/bleomycin/antimicrobial peptide transport system ATP-binding/permease protein